MSFYETYLKYADLDLNKAFGAVSRRDIQTAMDSDRGRVEDLIALLSPAAEESLEEMAQMSRELTLRYFGRTIQLYTPMYLSDYCENRCLYCGFNADNKFKRRSLGPEEVEREAQVISETGLEHILIILARGDNPSPLFISITNIVKVIYF